MSKAVLIEEDKTYKFLILSGDYSKVSRNDQENDVFLYTEDNVPIRIFLEKEFQTDNQYDLYFLARVKDIIQITTYYNITVYNDSILLYKQFNSFL